MKAREGDMESKPLRSKPERGWLDRLPKVELHVHLEGAIPHEALWKLVQKYGGDPAVPDLEALKKKFEYRDFVQFIETWAWKNRFLREYEDFAFIAEAAARDFVRQNIRYAEAFFSPADFSSRGLRPQELAQAVRRGLARVPGTRVALVADLVRDHGPEQAAVTLAQVREVRDQGVIGIGIGGSEHEFPPEPFAGIYKEARRLGFRTSAHAGEAAGAESVWGAVRVLGAERIGHGTRAGEDEALIDDLAERRIPLEMCPLSNLRTGVIGALENHPIRRFFDRGVIVTVNTDDPAMFGNSLADEYLGLMEVFHFSRDEIRTLILQAVRASWLTETEKLTLSGSFCRDPAWMEMEAGRRRISHGPHREPEQAWADGNKKE
ncbi:MAG: adenosine deaminase [Candidatus Aminicenantales bacterium]